MGLGYGYIGLHAVATYMYLKLDFGNVLPEPFTLSLGNF